MKAVLFDLGDTLIHPIGPWEPVMARACQALSKSLRERGVPLDGRGFASEFGAALHNYYASRETSLHEATTFVLLKQLLAGQGLFVQDYTIRAALDAHYRVTRSNWRAAPNALATLKRLRRGGLRLGVLSNAGDDDDVRILARESGFEPLLDFVVTSAQIGYRKPDERAFSAALNHWGFPRGDVVMVGDRLDADIGGAKRSGIHAVWITPHPLELRPEVPQPDATISGLSELPASLAGPWAQSPT